MERFLLAVSLILVAASPASHEEEEQRLREYLADPRQRIAQIDREQGNLLRVMNVAAHPDDEDGSSLTFLHRRYGYRAHIVYVTRGEGGQNEIGPELGDALGVIRSHECQAAAEGYGATISFLNALDFGFSKTAEETLTRWDFETMVQRMMTEIRWFRPDVILTHHTPDEGHGHHRATSRILREACNRVYQLDGEPWPLLLERSRELSAPDVVTIEAGVAVPAMGWTYAGLAHVALRRHRSQGMALDDAPTGSSAKHYRPAPGPGIEAAVWDRWRAADEPWMPEHLARLQPRSKLESPNLPAPPADWSFLRQAPHAWRITRPILLGDQRTRATGSGLLSLPDTLRVDRVEILGPLPDDVWLRVGRLPTTRPGANDYSIQFGAGARAQADQPAAVHLRSRSTVADSVSVLLHTHGGIELVRVSVPPRFPEVHLDIPEYLPPLTPGRATPLEIVWWGDRADLLTLETTPGLDARRGTLEHLDVGPTRTRIGVTLTPVQNALSTVEVTFRHPLLTRISGLEVLRLAPPKRPQVGFVEGVDGSLRRSLQSVGIDVVPLDDLTVDLSRLATIVVDVRAYQVRDDLKKHNERLLDYVRHGGHLVVQYQKTYEWNDGAASPWPPVELVLGTDRVVDETATVAPAHREHPFWHHPHELRENDWDGWVQERGLYFPTRWDASLTSLVSMSDAGEAPLDGAILVGWIGEGAYTYTSLAWHRQLRASVPGAYRAFFNLLFWPQVDD